eukprot:3855187-Pleurochrysis_carterae.AAC.1
MADGSVKGPEGCARSAALVRLVRDIGRLSRGRDSAGGVDCAALTSTVGRGVGCAESANGALLRNELKTRAMRKLKSGGYAECAVEFQPLLVLEPPAMCLWFT